MPPRLTANQLAEIKPIVECMVNNHFRVTEPRLRLVSCLMQLSKPLPCEEIHAVLKGRSCDLVTIYRNLTVLESLGIVKRIHNTRGTSLFFFSFNRPQPYFLFEAPADTVKPINSESCALLHERIQEYEKKLASLGHTNISHSLTFFSTVPIATY